MTNSLDHALQEVALLGAAGKMGRGIASLLLSEQAWLRAAHPHVKTHLTLIDNNWEGLEELVHSLKKQLISEAEKRINTLRELYASKKQLVSNEEMIHHFIGEALSGIHRSQEIPPLSKVRLVFEAVPEDLNLKKTLLSKLKQVTLKNTPFYSNTSSIPIGELARASGLEGQLVGFHFYNPPRVQRLLELIYPSDVAPAIRSQAQELALRLKKEVVESADVAGFIGNGHFLRELSFACQEASKMSPDSIFFWNRATGEYLIRPMGIFQLADYVGLDVCVSIAEIMNARLPGRSLQIAPLQQLIKKGKLGGQHADGSQKPGFFSYEGLIPKAIYNLSSDTYEPITPALSEAMGPLPKSHVPWKKLSHQTDKEAVLKRYFAELRELQTKGSEEALRFLAHSAEIVEQLVESGVSASLKDVETVLTRGFYHLYSPVNYASKELSK